MLRDVAAAAGKYWGALVAVTGAIGFLGAPTFDAGTWLGRALLGLVGMAVYVVAYLTGKSKGEADASAEAEREVKSLRGAVGDRDAEIGRLSRALDLAERNSDVALRPLGESFEEIRDRQRMLDTLSGARSVTVMRAIVDEKVNDAGAEENELNGQALADLVKYGCLRHVQCRVSLPDDRYSAFVSDDAEVVTADYPSAISRRDTDLMKWSERMVDEKIERAVRRFLR